MDTFLWTCSRQQALKDLCGEISFSRCEQGDDGINFPTQGG